MYVCEGGVYGKANGRKGLRWIMTCFSTVMDTPMAYLSVCAMTKCDLKIYRRCIYSSEALLCVCVRGGCVWEGKW